MLLTESYTAQISGAISSYDRINIKCTIENFGYAEGMRSFFYNENLRYFDYPNVFKPVTESIISNAEKIAAENGMEIEYIREVRKFRKDEKIDAIIEERGTHEGVVKIYSQLETFNGYRAWYDKSTGKSTFKSDTIKCLTYYFYFIDKDLGLCFVKVPTAAPFIVTVYYNGHGQLESKLKKAEIAYERRENAFTDIEDYDKAQELSDKLRIEKLHGVLDRFMARYCPMPKEWNLKWHYTIFQVEYALDIIFKEQDELKPIYDNIVKTVMHTVTPENIATFLGKRLTVKYEGEMGSRYNERVLGTRIKHQMGEISVKIYDKFGKVLRIEVTAHNVSKGCEQPYEHFSRGFQEER